MKSIRFVMAVVVAALAVTLVASQSSSTQAAGLLSKATKVQGPHGAGCCLPCCQPQVCYGNTPKPCCEYVTQIIQVCHPCTGCVVDVPVCVPCDCVGIPNCCSEGTLFGAGRNVYTWCCGYKVVVRFARCGDMTVYYR